MRKCGLHLLRYSGNLTLHDPNWKKISALFPFGDVEGDDVLDQSSQSTSYVPIDDGFPFGDQTEHDVYVSRRLC